MLTRFKSTQIFIFVVLLLASVSAEARYFSRFDVIDFKPAVDNSEYLSIYNSQTLMPWQGTMGFYFDYADRPLQFVATGAATGRQSVVDNYLVADLYGALGFTDWFEGGMTLPVVVYNWFFTDDAAAIEDNGGGMGDVKFNFKFRVVNTEKSKVGFAIMPFFTLPTGDLERYMGSGHVTGGAMLVTDFLVHPRFNFSLNAGYTLRDDVTVHQVRINDTVDFGVGANVKLTKNHNLQLIGEVSGKTVVNNLFTETNSMPIEADGGLRYAFGKSGFTADIGGGAGLVQGVGAPRFRALAGLKWLSPVNQSCPECPPQAPPPPPDPRIKEGKIVIWGKIYYDTDKSTIKPISYPVLDDVVDVMQKNQQVRLIEVQGHCDARASDAYNMKLSQSRAESAMQYLISKGVEASRLTAKGYGETRPVADNTTKEGMSQNRRTEFVILQQNDSFSTTTVVPASSTSAPGESIPSANPVEATPVATPESTAPAGEAAQ